jgi:glyoxylase-like metal-dependent hydrolase (beta-lactamase superfamily II)
MIKVYHLSCGTLQRSGNPKAICHCLLLEENNELVLIDTGIGMEDVANPEMRIGKELIELAGFKFNAEDTAVSQIRKLGFDPSMVKHIIMSHLDPDHGGGLADFRDAIVHVSEEEYNAFRAGNPRYLSVQLKHDPQIRTYCRSSETWLGLEARRVRVNLSSEVFLIPLFGHTAGHCGVAINLPDERLFYTADAYYLRDELLIKDHPVSELARINAEDDIQRMNSLDKIITLRRRFPDRLTIFGYHDVREMEV